MVYVISGTTKIYRLYNSLLFRSIFLVSAVIVEFVNFATQIIVVLIRKRGHVCIGQQLAFWGAYGLDPILHSLEGCGVCILSICGVR